MDFGIAAPSTMLRMVPLPRRKRRGRDHFRIGLLAGDNSFYGRLHRTPGDRGERFLLWPVPCLDDDCDARPIHGPGL